MTAVRALCLIVLAISMMAASCTSTRKQMRDRFAYEMQSCIGKNYSTFSITKECVGTRRPDEVTELPSGNRILVFQDFWKMYGIRREQCRVSLELDGDKVVSVKHDGPGCYMPY